MTENNSTPQSNDPIDAQSLTDRLVKRDRMRVGALGILCIIAWVAFVMLPWATILPMMARVVQYASQVNEHGGTVPQEQWLDVLKAVKGGTIATFLGSVITMFIAAPCTIWFVNVSRRATLRQVNARLAEISAQLKALSDK